MHYLCLIREIISWILTRVFIQRLVMTRVVIQPLNHKFTLNYDRVCFSWERESVCALIMVWYIHYLFLLTVKTHTDLIKRVLNRVIIPERIMTRVVNQCSIFTQGHNSTWNSDPSLVIPPVEYCRNSTAWSISTTTWVTIQQKSIEYGLGGPLYSIGVQIYLTPAFKMKVIYNCIIDCIIDNLGKSILMICIRFHANA